MSFRFEFSEQTTSVIISALNVQMAAAQTVILELQRQINEQAPQLKGNGKDRDEIRAP